jgi:cyclopropane-fatty-acyl-phospholipid synthase
MINEKVTTNLLKIAKRLVLSRFNQIKHGMLTIEDNIEKMSFGQISAQCQLSGTVYIHDLRFYSELAFGGSIGAGEAFMLGYWSTPDLTLVMRILLNNLHVVDGIEEGFARLSLPIRRLLHWASRNNKNGSRRNIAAHYDLGNNFFKLFLDPTMMYSSAIFDKPDMSLEQASIAKLDLICRKLKLQPCDHLLEIGSGWGGMALHAATHYGCKVTTTTISEKQYELAKERIQAAGLSDRITLLLQDYRDLTGTYDKLVSIEMIEAVGHQFYDVYFKKCNELLRPEGMMLLQAITISDHRYLMARNSVDFIQRYIFPGSCIPCVSVITDSIARMTNMRLFDLQDIGIHYATTLKYWHENLFANLDSVRNMGYPEEFIRMWHFYFSYCESGFSEGVISDVQMLFVKPLAKYNN